MQKGRLTLGVAAIMAGIAVGWAPLASAEKAFVEVTGQTTPFAEGDDGDVQAGVPLPTPRFNDNRNGTVKDNLTKLIWLKDASCFIGTWAGALAAVADLNAGQNFGCMGYVAGTFDDWRLPNVKELQSLIHFGFVSPALSHAAGTVHWTEGDPFSDARPTLYWSSTTAADSADTAWYVFLHNGNAAQISKDLTLDVWPVRAGK